MSLRHFSNIIFQVQKKIKEISGDTEEINVDFEQPEIFSQACDEQLLKWLNR